MASEGVKPAGSISEIGAIRNAVFTMVMAGKYVHDGIFGDEQMIDQFQPLADALNSDGYDGMISYENVYHPGDGDFENGFRSCYPVFKEIFA